MFKKEGCNFLKCANSVGLFLAVLFVLCYVRFYIWPVDQDLHLRFLRMAFFGFKDMGVLSFTIGLLQSYIWGYVGVGIWCVVGCCNGICWGKK